MRLRSVLFVLFVSLAVGERDAAATMCPRQPLQQMAANASAIFEATVSSLADISRPSPIVERRFRIDLTDVQVIRGNTVDAVVSSDDWLKPGRRYLFIANRSPDGQLFTGPCSGLVHSSARADGLRSWLSSLGAPPAGGRIFGAVIVRPWGDRDMAEWLDVAGARVVARGPVTVETITDGSGQYTFAGLPAGRYEISIELPPGRTDLEIPAAIPALLTGNHAAASLDFFASTNGTITGRAVDEQGRPLANQLLVLHDGPGADEAARGRFGLVETDGDGAFAAMGVYPGRYLLTLAGEEYLPVHARTQAGTDEIVVGWAEHVSLEPLVGRRGELLDVRVTVVDRSGRPVEDVVRLETLGPHGPLPLTGPQIETDLSGAFPLRMLRGVRYRLSIRGPGDRASSVDYLADGSPVTIVRHW